MANKISVALCTYNGVLFLKEQLESILNQTHAVDEIIICDDGSKDNTTAIVKEFELRYPCKISLYTHNESLGVKQNFSKAIQLCSGDVILLSDQDDIWMNNKVEEVVNYFNQHQDMLGVISNAQLINSASEALDKNLWDALSFGGDIDSLNAFKYMLLYRNIVTGACLAIKKEALSYIYPFTSLANMLHDEWIGLKLAERNQLGILNLQLTKYRIHSNQQTHSIWNKSEEENLIRQSIFNGSTRSYPYEHYKHWKRRLLFIQSLSKEGISINPAIVKEAKQKRKSALVVWLSSKKFFSRKTHLLKLWIKRKEGISIKDVAIV